MRFTVLQLVADIREEVVSDTYGEDGPYSGYSERRKILDIVGVLVNRVTDDPREKPSYYTEDFTHIDGEVAPGDLVHLVVARYSDGGTFGSTSGYHVLLGAYPDKHTADERVKTVKNNDVGPTPWRGYFASLESVSSHPVPVLRKVSDHKA